MQFVPICIRMDLGRCRTSESNSEWAKSMKSVVVASHNPVKQRSVVAGFKRMFPRVDFDIETLAVRSSVRKQPVSNEETLRGAITRAKGANQRSVQADYCVGIEGGIEDGSDGMQAFAWVAIMSKDSIGKARTGTFYLPERIADLIRQGKELGEADDLIFNRRNSRLQDGAVGILTENAIDRQRLYEHAVVLALVSFKNPSLYFEDKTTKLEE